MELFGLAASDCKRNGHAGNAKVAADLLPSGGTMPEAIDNLPACMLCKDGGMTYTPAFPPVFRFCACNAGHRRRASEPGIVAKSNAEYERVQGIGAGK